MWIEFKYMLKLKISFEINCKETTADKVKWLCYHIWKWLWFCISNHCHDDININIYVTLEIEYTAIKHKYLFRILTIWILWLKIDLLFKNNSSMMIRKFGLVYLLMGVPWWLRGKETVCQYRRSGFDSWVRKIPWTKKQQHTLVFLPGKFHG